MSLPSSVIIKEISISGIYKDPEFEKCCIALRYLPSYQDNIKIESNRYFPVDFEIMIQEMQKNPDYEGTSILYYNSSKSPLIIVNEKHILSADYFYEFLHDAYGYLDNSSLLIYKRMALSEYVKILQQTTRFEYVYMDFVINYEKMSATQKVVFAIDKQLAPKTAHNFIELIKGSKTGADGKKLHYKNALIHKVWKDGFIQGGDVDHQNGKGGQSIYGKYFEDETFVLKHNKPGLLGMANDGKRHTNHSQFYVTLTPLPKYDNKFIVFGRVVEGLRVIKQMSRLSDFGTRPKHEIKIQDCGIYNYSLRKNGVFNKD